MALGIDVRQHTFDIPFQLNLRGLQFSCDLVTTCLLIVVLHQTTSSLLHVGLMPKFCICAGPWAQMKCDKMFGGGGGGGRTVHEEGCHLGCRVMCLVIGVVCPL